jgi:hypothetical protein
MDNQVSINELINYVGHLSTGEFEGFFSKIQSLRLQKIAHDTNNTEIKLLKQIKTSLLSSKQMRFEYLIARRDARAITEKELEELIQLTNDIEKNDAIRFKRIAKLADLKHLSLQDALRFYNIQPMQHG